MDKNKGGPNPEDLIKKWHDGIVAVNRQDLEPYVALMDPDYVVHNPLFPEPIKGKEHIIEVNKNLFKAFPDGELRVIDITSNGEVVALQYMLTGTFKGPLHTPRITIPPTGRRFEAKIAEFDRVNSKGLVSEAYVYFYDLAGFRKQLGLTPVNMIWIFIKSLFRKSYRVGLSLN